MEQKVYIMLDLLKKAGYEEYLKNIPKIDFLKIVERIRDILEVPAIDIQEDIFELFMLVDSLLLRVSFITGIEELEKLDSLKLIDIFSSYNHIKCFFENEFAIEL